jgi:glycerophosphoryl diester phosphodiesterase
MNAAFHGLLNALHRPRRTTAIIGHRGAPRSAPENTLAAFEDAIELGVDGIEFDVQMTGDNALVVIHDADVGRCTNGNGLVTELTAADLRKLDAGTWLSPDFAGERIPLLPEALELMRGRVLPLVEIKLRPGIDLDCFVDRLLSTLDAVKMRYDVVLHGFDAAVATALFARDPQLHLGLTFDETVDAPSFVNGWHPHASLITPKLVKDAHRNGQWVCTWTVNDLAEAKRVIDAGVDGIMTDDPEAMMLVV